MLASEYLKGDNQYRCDNCKQLRDAERYTQLVALPPVSWRHSDARGAL